MQPFCKKICDENVYVYFELKASNLSLVPTSSVAILLVLFCEFALKLVL